MHGFDRPWDRMNNQQKEETRALFGALFGEPREQPAPTPYDPNKADDKQNFMLGLLSPDPQDRAKFDQYQRKLYDQETDRIREQVGKAPRPQTQQEIMQDRANRIADSILREGTEVTAKRIRRGEL